MRTLLSLLAAFFICFFIIKAQVKPSIIVNNKSFAINKEAFNCLFPSTIASTCDTCKKSLVLSADSAGLQVNIIPLKLGDNFKFLDIIVYLLSIICATFSMCLFKWLERYISRIGEKKDIYPFK